MTPEEACDAAFPPETSDFRYGEVWFKEARRIYEVHVEYGGADPGRHAVMAAIWPALDMCPPEYDLTNVPFDEWDNPGEPTPGKILSRMR